MYFVLRYSISFIWKDITLVYGHTVWPPYSVFTQKRISLLIWSVDKMKSDHLFNSGLTKPTPEGYISLFLLAVRDKKERCMSCCFTKYNTWKLNWKFFVHLPYVKMNVYFQIFNQEAIIMINPHIWFCIRVCKIKCEIQFIIIYILFECWNNIFSPYILQRQSKIEFLTINRRCFSVVHSQLLIKRCILGLTLMIDHSAYNSRRIYLWD